MARYSIRIKQSARKELEAIGRKEDRRRIVERISLLAEDPRPAGCLKLSAKERYRLRQGRCRILYSIEQEILVVYVIRIGHRKDVYRTRRAVSVSRVRERDDGKEEPG